MVARSIAFRGPRVGDSKVGDEWRMLAAKTPGDGVLESSKKKLSSSPPPLPFLPSSLRGSTSEGRRGFFSRRHVGGDGAALAPRLSAVRRRDCEGETLLGKRITKKARKRTAVGLRRGRLIVYLRRLWLMMSCKENMSSGCCLVVACCEGHTALLDMLLDAGVDIDQTDSKGWTPLHHCASLGYHGLACRLVERGASVCPVTSGDNATPLHLASMNGHANIVELMLGGDRPSARQASADEVDFAGMTPLHMASWRGHAPVVRVLLSAGANRDLKDKEGLTADTWASDGKHQEVQAILGSGYNKLRKARVKLKAAIAMKRGSLVKAIKVRCG